MLIERRYLLGALIRTSGVTAIALLGACNVLPRDPDGSASRIAKTHVVRVAIAADPQGEGQARAFLARLSRDADARPQVVAGSLEPLLQDLEMGKQDLVIAWFDHETPWIDRLALAPPLAVRGGKDHREELRAAARSGENKWIMLVEKVARQTSVTPTA